MKVLLVCNAGMSSSILIEKMKNAANAKGEEIEISATSISGISQEKGLWDVCLAGPQISYAVDRIKNTLEIPAISIDPRVYALADGEKALELAKKLYEASK